MITPRERAITCKTLICLLKSLIQNGGNAVEDDEDIVTISLRNDYEARGTVMNVDAFMNMELTQCTLARLVFDLDTHQLVPVDVQHFDYFFIKGTRIRSIDLPDRIDGIREIEKQLSLMRRRIQTKFPKISREEKYKQMRRSTAINDDGPTT